MGILGLRWRRLPARLRPPFAAGEYLLAFATLPAEQTIVVTNRGVWLPAEHGSQRERIEWHYIHKVAWSGGTLTITPAVETAVLGESDDERYHVMADAPALAYQLADPGQVPDRVRNRVNNSVAYTAHHVLPAGAGGVLVAARRVSGRDGLRWTARFDPGTDPDDPAVLARTAELVHRARTGLPTAE